MCQERIETFDITEEKAIEKLESQVWEFIYRRFDENDEVWQYTSEITTCEMPGGNNWYASTILTKR